VRNRLSDLSADCAPKQNVRFLDTNRQRRWQAATSENYKFLIIGEGSERCWLEKNLRRAALTARFSGTVWRAAYASMDLFVFPSQTDAFGNVVLEAMSAGVPAVVMRRGGPKFLIRTAKTVSSPTTKDLSNSCALKNPHQITALGKWRVLSAEIVGARF
jgi:glycosyltransferase involved in cell wall biosynthesis